MANYLIAILGIAALLSGWIWVQRITLRFALAHPEFGPPREEGKGGCGGCSCGSSSRCERSR